MYILDTDTRSRRNGTDPSAAPAALSGEANSMTGLYVVLVDGVFLDAILGARLKRKPQAADIVRECESIMAHPPLSGLFLLRIFYYHARSCEAKVSNPLAGQGGAPVDLGSTAVARHYRNLFQELELQDNFALRLGETEAVGWRLGDKAAKNIYRQPRPPEPQNLMPDIRQKGVDMRIGIDITWLALRRLVDVVVVVTADSDFVPVFKIARREGMRVYLAPLGHGVLHGLKAHADLVF